MPRRPCVFVEGAIHHVCCRTARREPAVLVGVERYGLRSRDLAAVLGRNADQISRWASQASRRKGQDEVFRRRLDALDAAVASGARGRRERPTDLAVE